MLSAPADPSPAHREIRREDCPEKGGDPDLAGYLGDVRIAGHDTFDRIVFEFQGIGSAGGTRDPNAAGVPQWWIGSVEPPFFYAESDNPVEVEGSFFLEFRFPGMRSPGAAFPKELDADLPVLLEAEESDDFHGGVGWILGLPDRRCWTVTEISDPPRIAIDIPR